MSVYPRVIIIFHDVHVFFAYIFWGKLNKTSWELSGWSNKCRYAAGIPMGLIIPGLVNMQKAMGNHHFSWENSLFQWAIFHSYVKLPESNAKCGSMVAIDQDMFFFVQTRLQGLVKPATMGIFDADNLG